MGISQKSARKLSSSIWELHDTACYLELGHLISSNKVTEALSRKKVGKRT